MTAPLQYAVETIEATNFGDHGERLRKSHVVVPGETVEALVRRVFPRLDKPYYHHDPTDEIVIRVLVDVDGTPTGDSPTPEVPPL